MILCTHAGLIEIPYQTFLASFVIFALLENRKKDFATLLRDKTPIFIVIHAKIIHQSEVK